MQKIHSTSNFPSPNEYQIGYYTTTPRSMDILIFLSYFSAILLCSRLFCCLLFQSVEFLDNLLMFDCTANNYWVEDSSEGKNEFLYEGACSWGTNFLNNRARSYHLDYSENISREKYQIRTTFPRMKI